MFYLLLAVAEWLQINMASAPPYCCLHWITAVSPLPTYPRWSEWVGLQWCLGMGWWVPVVQKSFLLNSPTDAVVTSLQELCFLLCCFRLQWHQSSCVLTACCPNLELSGSIHFNVSPEHCLFIALSGIPVVIYILERIARVYRQTRDVRILSAKLLPGKVVALIMSKPKGRRKMAGSEAAI